MWKNVAEPWRIAFTEAWDAYCHGSIPIGAVLIDHNGDVISRGRNRIHDSSAPDNQTCLNKLAHAEVNVLLQINHREMNIHPEFTLYTTTEPCILCFGAIVMAGVRNVRYAATDPIAGGANLNQADHHFIKARDIQMRCEHNLGAIQRVIRTDYLLRYVERGAAETILASEGRDYPEAVALGRRWFAANRLFHAKENGIDVSVIFDEICKELGLAL